MMTGYGLLVLLLSENTEVDLKKDLLVIGAMTLWALLGNTLYNGDTWEKMQLFNCFLWARFFLYFA